MEGSTSSPPNETPSLDKVISDLEQTKTESDDDSCDSCYEPGSNRSIFAEFFSSKQIDSLHVPANRPYTRIDCKASPEYEILEQLVQDDGVSVSAVLQQLFDHTNKAIKQVAHDIRTEGQSYKYDSEGYYIGSALDVHLRTTYYSWMDLVHINPVNKHAKLGEFITRLQRNKMMYTKSAKLVRLDSPYIGWKNKVWGDLPLFGLVVEEEDDFFDVLHPLHTPKQQECRENFIIMLARMTQRSPRDTGHDDDFYGPMNLVSAARNQFNDAFLVLWVEQPDNDDRVKTTEMAVRQACIWMIYAADALWHGIKLQEAINNSDTTPPEGGSKWQDTVQPGRHWWQDGGAPRGSFFKAWDKWRSGFQAVIRAHDKGEEHVYFHDAPLDARTGRMVYAALREMERVSGKEEE